MCIQFEQRGNPCSLGGKLQETDKLKTPEIIIHSLGNYLKMRFSQILFCAYMNLQNWCHTLFFFFLFSVVLGLHGCEQGFLQLEQGILQLWSFGFSLWWLLLLQITGSRGTGLVVVAHLSCSEACGTFLDQISNCCPVHWPSDSYPQYYQGSPFFPFYFLLLAEPHDLQILLPQPVMEPGPWQ